jgi:porin
MQRRSAPCQPAVLGQRLANGFACRPLVSTLAVAPLVVAITVGSARAEEPETKPESGWLEGEFATGNWGGLRQQLVDFGITPLLVYSAGFSTLASGGADDGNGWSYAGLATAGLEFDLEKMFGLTGASVVAEASWSSGQDLSEKHVGNLFPVAWQFTGHGVRLAQLYYQQNLFDDRLSLAIGRLTTEFDFLASDIYTEYFSGGINGVPFSIPAGEPGFTTAPFSQWGVRAIYYPLPQLRTAIGVYNADADVNQDKNHGVDMTLDISNGVMTIGEVGYSWHQEEASTGLPGNAKVGFVFNNGRTPKAREIEEAVEVGAFEFAQERDQGNNYAFYASIEQMVYRESEGSDQGLTPWAVVTYTPRDNININPLFVGGGMVYRGLIPGRDEDRAAIGVFFGKLSSALQNVSSEKVLEVNYTLQLTPWYYVRPDFQYIWSPSGDSSIKDAAVFGGEVGITF